MTALAGCTLLVGVAPAAADTTITVNTTLDSSPSGDGLCSLWEAVDWSQGGSEPDCSSAAPTGTTTIVLPAGRYVVPGTLSLSHQLDIVGAGSGQTDIDGAGFTQVMYLYPTANVLITGVEISGGESGTAGCSSICLTTENGNDGGGIFNDGALTLRDDLITGNTTGHGIAGLQLCLLASCPGNDGGWGGNGGGIYNNTTGTLTLDHSTVSNNTTGAGGAGNDGYTYGTGAGENGGRGGSGGGGGGIYNYKGALTIADSTITGNSTGPGGAGGSGSNATQTNTNGGSAGIGGSGGSGGGIQSVGGSVTITGSTLSGNTTGAGAAPGTPAPGNGSGSFGSIAAAGRGGNGGAFAYQAGAGQTATLSDDTLVGNSTGAADAGTDPSNGGVAGAIGFEGTGSLTNVTIADNSAAFGAGAIYLIPGSTLTESNSIIASNAASMSSNCSGIPLTDGGHNVVYGEASCPGTNADPKLQPLAENGGPTQTMRLGAGSAAADVVPISSCSVTADQRGIARPQGGGCDAGAYELAPPTLASLAVGTSGPGAVSVSGQVTPNLNVTTVSVPYGTSASYGSTSATTDVGSGSVAAPLTFGVSGLQPSTTYHFQVVATNIDGTTASGDLSFTTPATATSPATVATPAALTVSVPKSAIKGDLISVSLSCATGGGACTGGLKLSSRVTTRAGKVVAVAAAASRSKRPRRRTRVVTVGGGKYSLAAGQTRVVKLTLNAAGRRLLKARRRLPALLTTSGAAQISRRVMFVYRSPHHRKKH